MPSDNPGMDSATIATVLWTGLGIAIILGAAAVRVSADKASLALALASVALITVFSWLAALSIGPFVIAIAFLVATLTATRHLDAGLRVAALVLAVALYWLITWVVAPLSHLSLLILPIMSLGIVIGAGFVWRARPSHGAIGQVPR